LDISKRRDKPTWISATLAALRRGAIQAGSLQVAMSYRRHLPRQAP
jgi:hypothetical protein